MNIKEILKLETDNDSSIILHKEGLFWRAFEVSAFLFVQHVKEYQLTKKYYKNVNREVVYLGFPDSALEEVLSKTDGIVLKTDKQITIRGYQCTISDFDVWRKSIVVKEKKNIASSISLSSHNEVRQCIISFDTLNKTPFECQQFIMDIQQQIKDGTIQ